MRDMINTIEKIGLASIIILIIIVMLGTFTNTCNAQIKKAFILVYYLQILLKHLMTIHLLQVLEKYKDFNMKI